MIHQTKVLTLILFGLLFVNLSAQEDSFTNDPVAKLPDEDRKFRFGLQFSPNISWLKANTAGYESDGSEFGFSYGLSFEFFMSKNYLVSTGVQILNTGGKLNYAALPNTSISEPVTEDFSLKYIEIPINLKLRTNEIGYLTYFGQIGINSAINFRGKSSFSFASETANGFTVAQTSGGGINEGVESDAAINWINLSLVIGAGVEYNISGNTSLMLGLTFNNGFINQLDSKTRLLGSDGNVVVDGNGNPIFTEKKANANLNYFALNIGIYF
jgi:opacity protein-like surface antigen